MSQGAADEQQGRGKGAMVVMRGSASHELGMRACCGWQRVRGQQPQALRYTGLQAAREQVAQAGGCGDCGEPAQQLSACSPRQGSPAGRVAQSMHRSRHSVLPVSRCAAALSCASLCLAFWLPTDACNGGREAAGATAHSRAGQEKLVGPRMQSS